MYNESQPIIDEHNNSLIVKATWEFFDCGCLCGWRWQTQSQKVFSIVCEITVNATQGKVNLQYELSTWMVNNGIKPTIGDASIKFGICFAS